MVILLYQGGAAARSDKVHSDIASGKFGPIQGERLPLVRRIHQEINAALVGGGSQETARGQVRIIRQLFEFADKENARLTLESIESVYFSYADHLKRRILLGGKVARGVPRGGEKKLGPLSERSAYYYASDAAIVLDKVLNRRISLLKQTKLKPPKRRKSPIGHVAEKQVSSDTNRFGHMLQDLCDGLTLRVAQYAEFPVTIALRTDGPLFIKKPCYLAEAPAAVGTALEGRYSLANLRIEAELLMFIAQTGMNFSQAIGLEIQQFSYSAHNDGYQVRDYKARRGGEVLFEIFSEYKSHFERYLEWRRALFPTSTRIFPFVCMEGVRTRKGFTGARIRAVTRRLGLPYLSPQALRGVRVNWLLRMSANVEKTAAVVQHSVATMRGTYERPSFHRLVVESAKFWKKADPVIARTEAVAPGGCNGMPVAVPDIPPSAPEPDCLKKAGCLWCDNHRDVDSFDYVWAMTSFLHLKRIELSNAPRPRTESEKEAPAKLAIERLERRLTWFEQSNNARKEWVEEARVRILEGSYHKSFSTVITEMQGGRT
ncbi:site-specific integrase [Roseateles sp. DAIF2]|uniref:site-specific integrase n=1 Tax=Roseateles sp. DAIF2 TaxID=2714952 RepID=UPI0018A2896D|nr:site-specific integrase [Roseateles sp. DAIF2]QPF72696.1 site-specific integrase [Roseateles sp. DAIF2]